MTRSQPDEKPLQSWKEIAAYLDRDERTAMRWEREEGLPVRRHRTSGRGSSVYAYPSDLDAWRARRKPREDRERKLLQPRRVLSAVAVAVALVAAVWFIDKGPILSPPTPRAEAAGVVGMSARLVSTNPWHFRGSPFPDGKSISCTDWAGNWDIAVCNLKTGEVRPLSKHDEPGEFSYYSVVSPDGRSVAYTVFAGGQFDLRIISTDSKSSHRTERTIHRSEQTDYILPYAITPDSKQVLAGFSLQGEFQLVLVSVDDGQVTVLKSLAWRWPSLVSLSPNGRWIAYDVPVRDDSPDKDIFLLASDGSRETALIRRKGLDYGPVFTPDGGAVLFASDRSGEIGLWRVDVSDGKPQGVPQLVKSPIGRVMPVGITPGGALFYSLQSDLEDVYVAELGPETGRFLARPRLEIDRFIGHNFYPAWSPDGKRLAYFSRRHLSRRRNTLVIRTVETGEEVEHSLRLGLVAAGRWFPDGRSLLVPGTATRRRVWSLHRVDAASGEVTPLTGPLAVGSRFPRPAVSPDGRTVYYIARVNDPESGFSLIALDVETKATRALYSVPSPRRVSSVAVSPDGRRLALLTTETISQKPALVSMTISFMPASGGEPREIFRVETPVNVAIYDHGIEWTADGEYVLMSIPGDDQVYSGVDKWDVVRIPADGGETVSLGADVVWGNRFRFPSAHPDGRRIAFDTSSPGELERDLWVLENFLPQEPASE